MHSDDWLLLGGFAAVVTGIAWLVHPAAGLIVCGLGLSAVALLPRLPRARGGPDHERSEPDDGFDRIP